MPHVDSQQLEKLRIRSDSKQRRRGTPWLIFLGVLVVTGIAVYFGWPRQERRVVGHAPAQSGGRSAASPGTTNIAASGSATDAVLTVSGYIVNRERIEISP